MAYFDKVSLGGTLYDVTDTKGRAMIAPKEDTSTASAAHAKGTYFTYNDLLYRATADIAAGGTITPNTNCVAVTVGAETSDLKSEISHTNDAVKVPNLNNWVFGKFINSSGNEASNSTYAYCTDYIEVSQGDTLQYIGDKDDGNNTPYLMMIITYNSSKTFGTRITLLGTDGTTTSYTMPEDGFIRVNFKRNTGDIAHDDIVKCALNAISVTNNDIAVQYSGDQLTAIVNGYNLISGKFVNGNLASNGAFTYLDRMYRVSSADKISYEKDVVLKADSGFFFNLLVYQADGTTIDAQYTNQTEYTVSAGTKFKLTIRRTTENTSEIADPYDFASKIHVTQYAVTSVLRRNAESLHLYMPLREYDRFLRFTLSKVDNPSINALGWRINRAAYTNYRFSQIYALTANTEWDMAILLSGAPDFIGMGSHGSEQMTDVKFYVDGKEYDFETVTSLLLYDVNIVEMYHTSTMYDPTDETTIVGTHRKHIIFNAESHKITVDNVVEWNGAYTITKGYMFMVPLTRKDASHLITDTFVDNVDLIVTDCSDPASAFDPSAANGGVGAFKHHVTRYDFYGEELNLHGHVDITRREPYISTEQSDVREDSQYDYNKIYIDYCGGGYTTTQGEKWHLTAEVTMDIGA